ncbi:MAG: lectin like domain-containing protein [Synergistaceae bacterium]|jgi:C1A family cysteine protease|nr:lectin like domain-containing protein [Synergistaceae bacterium]
MSSVVFASIIALLGFMTSEARSQEGFWGAAPLSEAFLEYASQSPELRGEYGHAPSPIDLSHLRDSNYSSYLRGRTASKLPVSYDMRTAGLVTPVRNQEGFDSCWAFSALASMESVHLKRTGKKLDLSEMHLYWYAFNNQPGHDKIGTGGRPGGGWDNTAVSTMARWSGPAYEDAAPYGPYPSGPYDSYDNALYLSDAFFLNLQFAENMPQPTNDVRKQLIMEYGGISAGCYIGSRSRYYNEESHAWNYTGDRKANHSVLVIGWDDDYPADNFSELPQNNGAWLAKNSWGSSFGEDGFYWISYEDKSLSDGVVFVGDDPADYDNNYGYDDLGWCGSVSAGGDKSGWMANIFTASASGERLQAVSFYTTASDASYELFIYTNLRQGGGPSGGTLAYSSSGVESFAGYHTVKLSSPVALNENEPYSVVLRMSTPTFDYPIAVEMPVRYFSTQAVANRGESFVSSDGIRWSDAIDIAPVKWSAPYANACLRAFTSVPDPSIVTLALSDDVGNSDNWYAVIVDLGTSARVRVYSRIISDIIPSDIYVHTEGLSSTQWWIGDLEGTEVSANSTEDRPKYLVIEGGATNLKSARESSIGMISYKMGGIYRRQFSDMSIPIETLPGETNSTEGGGGCDLGWRAWALMLACGFVASARRMRKV